MFWQLFLHIIAGILGLWLANQYLAGVEFSGPFFINLQTGLNFNSIFETLVFSGFLLGFLNFFIKPILKIITLPLQLMTFGFFGLFINMGIIWIVDFISPKLTILGIIPLFLTSLIVWLLTFLLILFFD